MVAAYDTVAAFLDDLDPPRREVVEMLRAAILRDRPQLAEHIKWNSPSYVLDGVDRLTINVKNRQGTVQLVLHMGSTRREDKGRPPILAEDARLVTWQSDIRGVVTFQDRGDLVTKQAALNGVVTRWLKLT